MKYAIFIKPNSHKGPLIEKQDDGSFTVYVREPAVESKANDALVILLAKYFEVSKNAVTIIQRHTSRHKIVEIG